MKAGNKAFNHLSSKQFEFTELFYTLTV
jgi:hypothetical protein